MKRICNTDEKNLLLKNRNEILKGIYKTSAKGKYSGIFLGLFVSMIVMFAGIFICVDLFDEYSEAAFYVWVAFSFTVPNMIVRKVMNMLKAKKEVKAFLKKDNLMVNGATIVGLDVANGTFSYIEDDFLGADGRPVIIDYPEIPAGFTQAAIGKRIIVMYDGDSSFQLMKINGELRHLIPENAENYPLEMPLDVYEHVPHPNAVGIDYRGHVPSEEEKEKYADEYVKVTQGDAFKVIKICGIIIFVCVMTISVIFGIMEDCLGKALLIGLGVSVGFIVFILLMRMLGKVNLKKAAQFTYVQDVIFHSNVINQRGRYVSQSLKVYEWKNDKFELVEYPNGAVQGNTQYGSVLTKYINKKNVAIFMKKK